MPKKIPVRQCLGCREHKPKPELIRVVRSPEARSREAAGVPLDGWEVSLDFRGKKSGRGAYVCPDPECLKKCRKSKALERALEVPFPDEVWAALEEQMKAGDTDG